MSTPHMVDDLPSYALGILDEQDALRVREHLMSCAACQHELRAYQDLVGQLPLAAQQVDPSPRVKAAIMDRVSSGDQQAVVSGWSAVTSFFRHLSPAWSLVSLVLLIGLFVTNLFLWQRVRELSAVPQNHFRVVELSNTEAAPQATGLLVISPDGNFGTLIADGLPGLNEGMVYQVWLIKGEARTNGGVFTVEGNGYGGIMVDTHEKLDTYTRVGITIEPAGGSPGPTGARVLSADL